METIKISIDKGGYEPERGYIDDAGLDLKTPIAVTVPKGGSVVIDLGVRVEIPKGYYGKLESKSGLNINHGVVSLGGVIDSGYTGTIKVRLYNFGDEDYRFFAGDKCVQLIIMPCETPLVEVVEQISGGDRGESGYGSTGK